MRNKNTSALADSLSLDESFHLFPKPTKVLHCVDSMNTDDTAEDTSGVATPENSLTSTERELIDDLILQNKTMDALIKGLEEDIETFKRKSDDSSAASDIVRFTMQRNIMKDKKARNLAEINKIIKENKEESL